MLDLATELAGLAVAQGRQAPWPGHEYVKGWGVFALPFDSGHVLALRIFPESDFSPYRTVWHRDPRGRWSIHVNGPRLDTACPRYYGPACDYTGHAQIRLTWTGPATLHVSMDPPALEWTLTATSTHMLGMINTLSAALPLFTWRHRSLMRARERLARALGMGKLQLSGTMPSGHHGTLMPQQMYFISHSTATLDGIDLGLPSRLRDNPTIGGVTLPARGVLAIGQAAWEILDPIEYERTRSQTTAAQPSSGGKSDWPHAESTTRNLPTGIAVTRRDRSST